MHTVIITIIMLFFFFFAEQVTLVSQTEAADSNITEAQAKEVSFCTCTVLW